jgi:uncharacterized RDD family membrane protein YckC
VKRDDADPRLWEPDPAPEIDRALEDAPDDPLGRVLLQHPPALFPEGEPARRPEAGAPEPVSLFSDSPGDEPEPAPPVEIAAPPGPRLKAFAADALLCAIVGASSFLSAAAAVRRTPAPRGWIWCAAFALLLSFFLVVPTLALFGRTPGMALADLSTDDAAGEKPSFGASLRRWFATAASLLLAGLPLATMLFDRRRRTPSDLFSGRAVHLDREPVA